MDRWIKRKGEVEVEELIPMDSNSDNLVVSSSSSSSNRQVFKDLADVFYKLFTFLAALVALKRTDVFEKLLLAQPWYTTCVLAAIMLFFLLWVLYTLLQHPITLNYSFFPVSLLLLLGCLVSFLALLPISPSIAEISLALWIVIFLVIVIFNYRELYNKLSEKTNELIEVYKQQSERIPTIVQQSQLPV